MKLPALFIGIKTGGECRTYGIVVVVIDFTAVGNGDEPTRIHEFDIKKCVIVKTKQRRKSENGRLFGFGYEFV